MFIKPLTTIINPYENIIYPGDIISTGTPVHVLPMKDGDKVEIEINGIENRLINFVYDPKIH